MDTRTHSRSFTREHRILPLVDGTDGRNVLDATDLPATLATSRQVEAEQRLYTRGEAGAAAYLVTSGIVRLERVTAAGSCRIVRVAGPGDLIGQEALLQRPYGADAIACTPAGLQPLHGPWRTHADWVPTHTALSLLNRWQDALDESEFWSAEVTSGPARRRVLQLLKHLCRHQDTSGPIWLPKRDQMGAMLNLTTETCSRVMSALRREGVLTPVPSRLTVLDLARLTAALSQADR